MLFIGLLILIHDDPELALFVDGICQANFVVITPVWEAATTLNRK